MREKLAIPEAEWPRAIEELTAFPHIAEAAVLSTCNRMELYCVCLSWHRGVREIEEWLSHMSGIPLPELLPYLFLKRDRDATWHLLRVASGLESLVMGEGQILAQVKQARRRCCCRRLSLGARVLRCACCVWGPGYVSPTHSAASRAQVYKVGQEAQGFGRHLNGLFKQAITAGKRVRSETSIASGSVSISSAAAELAQLKLPSRSFADASVAIIGAGKMSTLLVKHLAAKHCAKITILNRSAARAEALAEAFPDVAVEVRLMPDLLPVCEAADVIFAASGSEEILVDQAAVAAFRPAGTAVGGLRRFFDISVPRNIARDVSNAPGNVVFNVDDLKEVRARALARSPVYLL